MKEEMKHSKSQRKCTSVEKQTFVAYHSAVAYMTHNG